MASLELDAAEQVATLSPNQNAELDSSDPAPGEEWPAPTSPEKAIAPAAPSNQENEVETQDEPPEDSGAELDSSDPDPGEDLPAATSPEEAIAPAAPNNPENEDAGAEPEAEPGSKEQRDITPLLMARVKKIIRLDKEIKLVSRPALSAITTAARMFMESLASQAFNEMLRNKHKSLRLAHLEGAVRRKREYLEFLDDSMEIFAAKKNKAGSSSSEDEEEEPEINKIKPPPPGTRCITEFFSKNSDHVVEKEKDSTKEPPRVEEGEDEQDEEEVL